MRYQQIDIRKKILIPIVLISFVGVLLTVLITLHLMEVQSDQTVKKEIEHAKHLIKEALMDNEARLMPEAIMLASDVSIREGIEQKNSAALVRKLIPVKVTFNVDGIKIIDAKGTEIIRLGSSLPTPSILVNAGFDLERVALFVRSGNEIWLTAVAPIRSRDGKLIGLVLVGNKISKTLIKEIKKGTGADVVISFDNLFVGSSSAAEEEAINHSFEEESLDYSNNLTEIHTMDGEPCLIDRFDLKTSGGNKIRVYTLTSISRSNQAKRDNAIAILSVSLAALLVSIIVAYIVGYQVTKPIKVMAKRARLIAEGDYKQRIDYSGVREIDELATSFNIMSEALEANRQCLEERAYTDSLTGLYNHRYFQDSLTNELMRSDRYKHPLSLIVIDIDDFKKVNDNFGHKKGDTALQLLADRMKAQVRETDIPCRIGGEEFAIILPETTSYEAYTVAERLRMDVASQTIPDIGKITISLGISTFPDHATDKESIIEAADVAMYHSKRNGKNMTSIYNGEPLVKLDPQEDKWLTEESYYMDMLHALISHVEAKDQSVHSHSERVSMIAGLIGLELGLSHNQVEHLRIAGLLHDIGKIAVPDYILAKSEPLTEEEFEKLKPHPIIGEQILQGTRLQPVLKAVLYHHERLDGSGYPYGLKGDEIPLYARIIAVADTFEAMISGRPYHKAMSVEESVAKLKQDSRTKFDEEVVNALDRIASRDDSLHCIAMTSKLCDIDIDDRPPAA
ncbi:MAG: diguanylate cyclase [Actinomycetota bacterium]